MDFSAGELIILGFDGKTLSDSTLQTIQRESITQFILFAHNYESKEQLIELTDSLQALSAGLPMIISADQEGGRVQRFKNGFSLLPAARTVGDTDAPHLAFELARIQAKELFAAGIQLNFAPICDINTNLDNPVIGDRAYGDHEERVSKMSSAVVRGHLVQKVEACIKHFPGHGDTQVDSHFSLPTVTTELSLLKRREWVPFQKAIKAGANFLMSAHILLPHLDSRFPGTLSKTFLQDYLRDELLYTGVVVSDDMEMHAITHHFGAEEAPLLALEAGCDLLCYRSEAAALIAIESIKKAISEQRLLPDQLQQKVNRVRKIREKIKLAKNEMKLPNRLSTIGHADHAAMIEKNF